jgi:phage-related protein
MKPLLWVGSSLADIRAFPASARREAGYRLYLVQQGLGPPGWKPMPQIGPGVAAIRIRTNGQHRVFYLARLAEGVYVLHAFEKKTGKTARRDIALACARYREVLRQRGDFRAERRRSDET